MTRFKAVTLLFASFACFLVLFAGSAMAAAVPFQTLDKGAVSYYRYGDPAFLGAEMVIKDFPTWSAFWTEHTKGIDPAPPLPRVDFAVDMVAVVILGHQTTGGPAVEIKSVDDLTSNTATTLTKNLRISVAETEKPGLLTVITNPFHIIKVAKGNSVTFEHGPLVLATSYQLSGSTYNEGCVDPCYCPVRLGQVMDGAFNLIKTGEDQWFKYYNVDQIAWTVVDASGQVLHKINGNGTYKVGGDFALTHEMVLNLAIDGQAPAVFKSGLVPGGGEFPSIAIKVDKGDTCYNIWLDVAAKPVSY